MNRLNLEEYGCLLTIAGKSRSEDNFTQVSVVGFDKNKRICGICYNGLDVGMTKPLWMDRQDMREKKSLFWHHAELNLLSLIKKDECKLVCCSISPCFACLKTLCAHGIKKIVYWDWYERFPKDQEKDYYEYLKFYNIDCYELSKESKQRVKDYLLRETDRL